MAGWTVAGKTDLQIRKRKAYLKRRADLAERYQNDTEYRETKLERQRRRREKIGATPEGRAAMRAELKQWAIDNPVKYAEIKLRASHKHRLKKHGLTIEQFDVMLAKQNYCCAICKSTTVGTKRNGKGGKASLAPADRWPSVARPGSDRTWHVDHDHQSGKVRGLLCVGCNTALGMVKDNTEVLAAMIEYLITNRR
jgi:hypothetical protein